MRAYIIRRTDSGNLESKITSILAKDVEIVSITDSYEALDSIKLYGKPCIVFIQTSKIANNGKDYISELKKCTPYTYVIVVCEGSPNHRASYSKCPIVCDTDVCNRLELIESIGSVVDIASKKVEAVCKLKESVCDIQNNIGKMKERTKLWATKFTMNS